jgi:hypothetical protein
MTSFNYGDCALQMSSSTGTGTGTGGGSNLQGNSGFQNGSGGNGGNPGGLPGGNNEGIGSYTTERRIVHEDSSWSNTIRTLFINGSGGWRLMLSRNGTPAQRVVIIGSSLIVDAFGRVIQNVVNDPNYAAAQHRAWLIIWNSRNRNSTTVHVDPVTQQTISSGSNSGIVNTGTPGTGASSTEVSKNMIGGDFDLGALSESILNKIADYLDYIFEPVQLSFSNEVMSQQIQNVSIILWILTVCMSIFFIALLFNIALFIFSGKLQKYFTNKYILWYLSFNKKIIGFEIFMLSGWIFYILYLLLIGLHYIAIHPVISPV